MGITRNPMRGEHRILWEQKERTFEWVHERLTKGFGAKLLKDE